MNKKDHEVFSEVLTSPGFYIRFKSVERADAFIRGYAADRGEAPSEIYSGFSEWLQRGYGIKSQVYWCRIVKLLELSEEGAFDAARDLWFRYLGEIGGVQGDTEEGI